MFTNPDPDDWLKTTFPNLYRASTGKRFVIDKCPDCGCDCVISENYPRPMMMCGKHNCPAYAYGEGCICDECPKVLRKATAQLKKQTYNR